MKSAKPSTNTLLADLWYGRICPQESGVFNTSELRTLAREMSELRVNLHEKLTDEQKNALELLNDCEDRYRDVSDVELFVYAFKLGARTMLQIMSDDNIISDTRTATYD